ncbi:MAG: hypothetical protein Q9187_009417, partial [Circinaria calcarea]
MPIGGTVYQDVYIRSTSPGTVMTVTDVRFVIPNGGYAWWPTLAINGGLVTKDLSEERKKAIIPFGVEITNSSAFLCTAGLTSQNVLDSGEGPRIEIEFRVRSTGHINEDKSILYTTEKKGFITISTDHWGGPLSAYSRPDYRNVTYQLADSSPVNLPNRLGVYKPKDVSFVIAADLEKRQITMHGNIVTNSVQEIAQSTFSGVSRDYKRAVGWVFGTGEGAD